MAFESLSERISAAFKNLRSKGRLTERDIRDAMREIRMALLEADVNYKVARDFIKTVSDKAVGTDVLESLTPGQQVIKIVNDEAGRAHGRHKRQNRDGVETADGCDARGSAGRR